MFRNVGEPLLEYAYLVPATRPLTALYRPIIRAAFCHDTARAQDAEPDPTETDRSWRA
jgi:hypothetical protein